MSEWRKEWHLRCCGSEMLVRRKTRIRKTREAGAAAFRVSSLLSTRSCARTKPYTGRDDDDDEAEGATHTEVGRGVGLHLKKTEEYESHVNGTNTCARA